MPVLLGRLVARLIREPLLHFLLIGASLFAIYGALDDAEPPIQADVLVVDTAQVDRLAASFQAVWRRPPTEAELAGLIDEHIREEVFVREALALGLDRDDTIVRRRLRQKMEFLTQAGGALSEPSEAELRALYLAEADRFTVSPKVAFEQVFLGEDASDAAVVTALDALRGGADPATLGERSLLPAAVPLSPPQVVDGTFGRDVFVALSALDPGQWTGPIRSAFGIHLVFVRRYEPATLLSFEEVAEEVRREWTRRQTADVAEERFEALRDRYRIVVESGNWTVPAPGGSNGR